MVGFGYGKFVSIGYQILLAFAMFIVLRTLISYASLVVAVTFLGGLQLIGIGVLGEYLGRTYIESKRRPVFLVWRIYDPKD